MDEDALITVPELFGKLDALYKRAARIKDGSPTNHSRLAERLYADRKALGVTIRSPQITAACNPVYRKRFSVRVHRAILALFGIFEIPRRYYDPTGLGEDLCAKKFARSLVPDGEKVVVSKLLTNKPNAMDDALFVMDVEDVSDGPSFTGRIIINPADDDILAAEDDPLVGKAVGLTGFKNVRVYVVSDPHGEIAARDSQDLKREPLTEQEPEITAAHRSEHLLWRVSMRADEEGNVEPMKGRFEVGDFDIVNIQSPGVVEVVALAKEPMFKLLNWVIKSQKDVAQYHTRYNKIAQHKVRKQFLEETRVSPGLTLSRVILRSSGGSK